MTVIKNVLFKFLPGKILFLIKKSHYLRKLKKMSEEDEEDLGMLKNFLREGDHVLDIGAHIGVYTRFLSLAVGPKGNVYSFEPNLSYKGSALGINDKSKNSISLPLLK